MSSLAQKKQIIYVIIALIISGVGGYFAHTTPEDTIILTKTAVLLQWKH